MLAWMEGTALRPVRAALDAAGWADFRAELGVRLAAGVPGAAGSGVLPVPPDLRRRPHRRPCRGEPVTDLSTFIAGLPKVELHVHHVGSASPRIVAELAARHEGRSPVPADPEALADYFAFRDFAHFIEVYLSVVDLIRDPEDVWLLTHEVARELARQQVRYAELTVTPYSHVRRGIPAPAFCEAIEDARKRAEADFGIALRWCFDIPGEAGLPAAEETLRIAWTSARTGWSASASAAPRSGCPGRSSSRTSTRPGRPGCARCRTPARPPARRPIWDALRELGAERIGHGISAAQDPRAAGLPGRAADPAGGLPDLQRAHPGGRPPRRAPAAAAGRGRACWSPSTPTTRRCSAPPSTTSTRWPPACSAPAADGLAGLARDAVTASFLDPAGKQRITRRDRRLPGRRPAEPRPAGGRPDGRPAGQAGVSRARGGSVGVGGPVLPPRAGSTGRWVRGALGRWNWWVRV